MKICIPVGILAVILLTLFFRVWCVVEETRYSDMLNIGLGLQHYCQNFDAFPSDLAAVVTANDLPNDSKWYSVKINHVLYPSAKLISFDRCEYEILFASDHIKISIPEAFFSGWRGIIFRSLKEDRIEITHANGRYLLKR
jgi:hypothetical protein